MNKKIKHRLELEHTSIVYLQGFYEEVATPLTGDGGSSPTQTKTSQDYNGSGILVAGEITHNDTASLIPKCWWGSVKTAAKYIGWISRESFLSIVAFIVSKFSKWRSEDNATIKVQHKEMQL